jgi:hypothetical protein
MKLSGNSRGNLQEGQGGVSQSRPLRSDGSHDSQAEEARLHERWPKATLEEPSGSSPLRSDGSRDSQVVRLDSVSSG